MQHLVQTKTNNSPEVYLLDSRSTLAAFSWHFLGNSCGMIKSHIIKTGVVPVILTARKTPLPRNSCRFASLMSLFLQEFVGNHFSDLLHSLLSSSYVLHRTERNKTSSYLKKTKFVSWTFIYLVSLSHALEGDATDTLHNSSRLPPCFKMII